jgi:hypothetical protein
MACPSKLDWLGPSKLCGNFRSSEGIDIEKIENRKKEFETFCTHPICIDSRGGRGETFFWRKKKKTWPVHSRSSLLMFPNIYDAQTDEAVVRGEETN